MNDPKNIIIAMLCVSATILATVFALGLHDPKPAQADTPVVGGDYIMVPGQYSTSLDLLYVIDIASQRMNVYVFNLTKGELVLRSTANLKLAFQRPR